uniref:Uncharacterized protein n=1 Tax=Oryzias latipes TaxID=8090 RepID=A0A3B3I4X6_ORYLA
KQNGDFAPLFNLFDSINRFSAATVTSKNFFCITLNQSLLTILTVNVFKPKYIGTKGDLSEISINGTEGICITWFPTIPYISLKDKIYFQYLAV